MSTVTSDHFTPKYGFTQWLSDPERDWDGNPFGLRFMTILLLIKSGLPYDVAKLIFEMKDRMEEEEYEREEVLSASTRTSSGS